MAAKVYDIGFKLNGAVSSKFTGSMMSASKTVGVLGKNITSLEKARKQSDRFTSLKKEIRETEAKFFDAQTESKALAAQLAATEKPTKKLRNQFEAANRKTKKLKDSLGEQRTSLAGLRREMTSAGIKTGQLVKHNQRLAQSIDLARRKQEKLQKIMMKQKAVQDKRSGMQGKLFDAAAIGAAVGVPVMIAAKFEQSMAEVKSLTGATGKDFTALTAKARLLGSTTSFSASEAAQGMKYLGMAGFETQQIIAAMPGVLNMAKAGAVELGTASDIASDIMSGFSLKAEDMGRVSDVLTRTFTSSNTSLEMLGETMKYVAPVASKAGMSLEQTAAMAGLLGNVGIKGSMAGTTLKGMVLSIAGQSKGAAIAIGDLGVKTKDSEGNLRPFAAILGDISKATKDMGNAEKLDLVKTIFGKESAAGITELISQAGEDGIEGYIKKVSDSKGAAEQIAKVMDNTTVGAFKNLGSAAEGLAIVAGNTLLPAITGTAKGLAFVTRGITTVAEKFPFATKVVGLLAGGTVALTVATVGAGYAFTFVTGGLLQAQKMYQTISLALKGATARTIAYSAWNKVTAAATGIMTAAQWGFNAALAANPIGLAVMGVAALSAGAVALYRNFEPFTTLMDNTWALIKSFGGGAWSGLTEGLAPVVGMFTEMKTAVGSAFAEIRACFTGIIGPVDQSGAAMAGFATVGKFVGKTFSFVLKAVLLPVLATIKAITFAANVAGKVASFFNGSKSSESVDPKVQDVSNAANAEVIRLQTASTGAGLETRQGLPEVKKASNSSSTSIEYKPQISITATGSNVAEFKAATDQSLMESEERFRKMQAGINHDDRRRALG